MDHYATALLAAVAARLDAVVPRPRRVTVDGNRLWLEEEAGGQNWGMFSLHEEDDEDLEDDDRSLAERAAAGASSVLNQVQDWVSRSLTEPWPRTADGRMAGYDARTDGESIHLWYGPNEAAAVVTFPPIAVRDLLEGPLAAGSEGPAT